MRITEQIALIDTQKLKWCQQSLPLRKIICVHKKAARTEFLKATTNQSENSKLELVSPHLLNKVLNPTLM